MISHSGLNYTACAGSYLRNQIPGIKRRIEERIDKFADQPIEPPPEEEGGGSAPR